MFIETIFTRHKYEHYSNLLVFCILETTCFHWLHSYTSLWQIILRKYDYKYCGSVFQCRGHHDYNKTSAYVSSKNKKLKINKRNNRNWTYCTNSQNADANPLALENGRIQAPPMKVNGTCQSDLAWLGLILLHLSSLPLHHFTFPVFALGNGYSRVFPPRAACGRSCSL